MSKFQAKVDEFQAKTAKFKAEKAKFRAKIAGCHVQWQKDEFQENMGKISGSKNA